MDRPSCRTYFAVIFSIDVKKNAESLRAGRMCPPEELGIVCREQVGEYIRRELGADPVWDRHRFVIGYHETYDPDLNVMLRRTLAGLSDKTEAIRRMQQIFPVAAILEAVPCLVRDAEEPLQLLSPARDIVEFLYRADVALDFDLCVI